MSSYQEFKSFYSSNIIFFVVLLFVIVYIVINWKQIYNGNYFYGQFVKPILISGIIFLVVHMLITWDDNTIQTDYPSDIPLYKLGQNNEFVENNNQNLDLQDNYKNNVPITQPNVLNSNIQSKQFESKYKISNRFDNENYKSNPLDNIFSKNNQNQNTDSKLSNQNIFISHKNSAKYGLKFN